MRKIYRIISALTFVLSILSCEDDGGSSQIELIEAAVPNFQIEEGAVNFADFISIEEGQDFDLSFEAGVTFGNLTKGDIVAVYIKSDDPETEVDESETFSQTLLENVSFPEKVTVSFFETVNSFDGLSVDDITLGDRLIISSRLIGNDGTLLNTIDDDGNVLLGGNLRGNPLFNALLTYPVSCETKLEGMYTATVSNISGAMLSDFPNNGQTVEITQPSSGTYILSDATANTLGALVQLQFTDVCGNLTVTGPSVNFPGLVIFDQKPGTMLNEDTGVITLDLAFNSATCCGAAGTAYTLELVPVN